VPAFWCDRKSSFYIIKFRGEFEYLNKSAVLFSSGNFLWLRISGCARRPAPVQLAESAHWTGWALKMDGHSLSPFDLFYMTGGENGPVHGGGGVTAYCIQSDRLLSYQPTTQPTNLCNCNANFSSSPFVCSKLQVVPIYYIFRRIAKLLKKIFSHIIYL
jgi:hypothetical protein